MRAVPEARELATRLSAAFEDDGAREAALAALDLDAIRDRLALAYALDGSVRRDRAGRDTLGAPVRPQPSTGSRRKQPRPAARSR